MKHHWLLLLFLSIGVSSAQAQTPRKRQLPSLLDFRPYAAVSANTWTFTTGNFTATAAGREESDVLGYSRDNGTVWVGADTGNGFDFDQWGAIPAGSDWTFLAGDATGDGVDDAIGYDPGSGVIWLGVNEGSSFTLVQWSAVSPPSGWTFAAGDVTGNSFCDLVGHHPSTDGVWVGINLAWSIQFQLAGTLPAAGDWTLAVGDYLGDSRDDVVAHRKSNGSLWVARSLGILLDSFEAWANVAPGAHVSIDSAYFGGHDGRLDLLAHDTKSGQLWIGLNTGDGFTMRRQPHPNPSLDWQLSSGVVRPPASGVRPWGRVIGYRPTDGSLWVGDPLSSW